MPNLPVRNLGGTGIVSDIHPYDLPPNALSAGVNVRFENGKITRAPVMRRVYEYVTSGFEPAYFFSIPPVSGPEALVAVKPDGSQILAVTGSTVVDVTPATPPTPATTNAAFSHTFLGNVAYLNRNTGVPLQKRAADPKFLPLTGWSSSDRCVVLRSYKDFLVALNVTKGATEYTTMVKWSNIAAFGGAPPDWDYTSSSSSAGENIINEMREPIVDGMSLRDSFVIYGHSEVWLMDYIGGNFLFRFRKLYDSVGVINQNCVAQVDGMHYVFDANDIWVHDGASKKSIIHGQNKDYVFNSLVKQLSHLCFVTVDPRLNEIHFCYPSQDRLTGFRNPTTGCNRSAVYNYRTQTWSFYDLPNVTGATLATLATGDTWTTVPDASWDDIGGSYLGADDEDSQYLMFAGRPDSLQTLTKPRIYGLDLISGGRLVKPIDPETVKPSFIERIGLDMDEAGATLASYKAIHAIVPQVELEGDTLVEFQFGSSDTSGGQPLWGPKLTFDPRSESKVDCREAGRYLGWRMYFDGPGDFSLSGLDARIVARGKQ